MAEETFDATNITVNAVELASSLAEKATADEFGINIDDQEELESVLCIGEDHEDYDEDCSAYTEEAQKVFDRWYDYFYDKILEAKS